MTKGASSREPAAVFLGHWWVMGNWSFPERGEAMASDKQKRKAAKKPPAPGKPSVHPDGDRRRRGGPSADQATRDKRLRQNFTGGVPEDLPSPKPAGEESDESDESDG
jgi:hypothetical protein